jgi:hypothetical protein
MRRHPRLLLSMSMVAVLVLGVLTPKLRAAWTTGTGIAPTISTPAASRVWLAGSDHSVSGSATDTDYCAVESPASQDDEVLVWFTGTSGTFTGNANWGLGSVSTTYICSNNEGSDTLTLHADDDDANVPAGTTDPDGTIRADDGAATATVEVSVVKPDVFAVNFTGDIEVRDLDGALLPDYEWTQGASINYAAVFGFMSTLKAKIKISLGALTDTSLVTMHADPSGLDLPAWEPVPPGPGPKVSGPSVTLSSTSNNTEFGVFTANTRWMSGLVQKPGTAYTYGAGQAKYYSGGYITWYYVVPSGSNTPIAMGPPTGPHKICKTLPGPSGDGKYEEVFIMSCKAGTPYYLRSEIKGDPSYPDLTQQELRDQNILCLDWQLNHFEGNAVLQDSTVLHYSTAGDASYAPGIAPDYAVLNYGHGTALEFSALFVDWARAQGLTASLGGRKLDTSPANGQPWTHFARTLSSGNHAINQPVLPAEEELPFVANGAYPNPAPSSINTLEVSLMAFDYHVYVIGLASDSAKQRIYEPTFPRSAVDVSYPPNPNWYTFEGTETFMTDYWEHLFAYLYGTIAVQGAADQTVYVRTDDFPNTGASPDTLELPTYLPEIPADPWE